MNAALPDAWRRLAGEGAQEYDGILVALTGIPDESLNPALVLREPDDPERAVAWALGVRPYKGFDLPDGAFPSVERALHERGHRRHVRRRGMTLDLAGWTPPPAPRIDIVPATIDEYVDVAVDAFGDRPEMVRALGVRSMGIGARVLLGLVDGFPVSTATGVDVGDTVGIFGVATRKAYRGRGYGTALTSAAVGTAARTAWLQATDAGYPVYRSMGFRDTGEWVVWTG